MIDFSSDIEQCLQVLSSGGIILYPTDTIWGLGCDATNADAVKKLVNMKGKPDQKGLIILLPIERDIINYVAAPDPEVFIFLDKVKKPTTVIYPGGLLVAENVLHEDGSIAIRVVKEDFCRHLLKRFKKPIVSTSSNFHGQPSASHFNEIGPEIKQMADFVVNYRQNEHFEASASSLVKWTKEGPLYLRQ